MSLFHALLSLSGGSTVVLTSSASNVDGLFHLLATFNTPVSGLTVADFSVTNGSAEYLIEESTTVFRLMVMPDGVGDVQITLPSGSVSPSNAVSNTLTVTINTAWQYLTQSSTARLYYDFRELFDYHLAQIKSYDYALNDLSGNNRDLLKVSTPTVRNIAGITDYRLITATGALSIQLTGSTIFNSDFSVNFWLASDDGIQAQATRICGNQDGTNWGMNLAIESSGLLTIVYQGFTWQSTAAVMENGACAHYFDIHFDFTNDVLTVNRDGSSVAGSFTVSNISAVNPASYNCTANFYIGARNNNGTTLQNINTAAYLKYFCVTGLQSSPTPSAIRTYLNAKKPTFELVDILTSTTLLKAAHHIDVNTIGTVAYVAGKGDASLFTVDGSFATIDLSDPTTLAILDSEASTGDLIDCRTSVIISSTRVIVFAQSLAILYDVSNPAAITRLHTLAYSGSSGISNYVSNVNGAIYMNGYVFASNMDGGINVFTVTGDVIALVGFYSTFTNDGIEAPLDLDQIDSENICICNIDAGANFAIYKVFNAGALIPTASWTLRSSITNALLDSANRITVNEESTIAMSHQNAGANTIVSINLSNLDAPAIIDDYSIGTNHSSGKVIYRNKYDIGADGEGIVMLNISSNPLSEIAGYFDRTNFTSSDRNTHETAWFINNNQNYVLATFQDDSKLACWKINRI